MCLKPLFTLTPNEPWINTYDPAQPSAPWVFAGFNSWGGITSLSTGSTLPDQHAEDKLRLGYDAVPLANNTILSYGDIATHCTIGVSFQVTNVTAKNQTLLVFKLKGMGPATPAVVQFFLGGTFLEAHPLALDDQHAILIDIPGSGIWVTIHVRLASPNYYDLMEFFGVDCCLV